MWQLTNYKPLWEQQQTDKQANTRETIATNEQAWT